MSLRAIVEAARAAASDPALVAPLMESTGLSRAGVELGLTKHLELSVTDEELSALVDRTPKSTRAHVILSANVFVAALRALVLARAAAPRVTVRPSRRDPVFARAIVERLADPNLVELDADVATIGEGEIHVYGRDETIADVRRRAKVPVRGHGAGLGIAWIPSGAALDVTAAALADDVVAFDQRGCLSPRVVLVEDDPARFGRALARALEDPARPARGRLDESERADAVRWASTVSFAGELVEGETSMVGWSDSIVVPPSGRHVHVVPWRAGVLDELARFVVTVGSTSLEAARSVAPPHARLALVGSMQRPPLDGPVDRRDPFG